MQFNEIENNLINDDIQFESYSNHISTLKQFGHIIRQVSPEMEYWVDMTMERSNDYSKYSHVFNKDDLEKCKLLESQYPVTDFKVAIFEENYTTRVISYNQKIQLFLGTRDMLVHSRRIKGDYIDECVITWDDKMLDYNEIRDKLTVNIFESITTHGLTVLVDTQYKVAIKKININQYQMGIVNYIIPSFSKDIIDYVRFV